MVAPIQSSRTSNLVDHKNHCKLVNTEDKENEKVQVRHIEIDMEVAQ